MTNQAFIQVDGDGYFVSQNVRYTDNHFGHELLKNIKKTEFGAWNSEFEGKKIFIEAFDEPIVIWQVSYAQGTTFKAIAPYEFETSFTAESLTLDEWDRFHGITKEGVSFVFSRSAQGDFFNQLEDYDDDSIVVNGQRFSLPPWLSVRDEVKDSKFWTDIYNNEPQPPWELNEPTPLLISTLPQLKLPKSRVIVLGCGSGNDAAYFAQQGHIVTAIDYSDEALRQAQKKFGHLKNIQFIKADIFDLNPNMNQQFDIVFEHTCYCAIQPQKRNELTQIWKRLLNSEGHLLGVFFAMDKHSGPPFGGSEWEISTRLKRHFDFLYWTRAHNSVENRMGKELIVYARKKRSIL